MVTPQMKKFFIVKSIQSDDTLRRLQQPSPAEQQPRFMVISKSSSVKRRQSNPPDLLLRLPRPRSAGTRSEPGRARRQEAEQPPERHAAQKSQVSRAAATAAAAPIHGILNFTPILLYTIMLCTCYVLHPGVCCTVHRKNKSD